MCFETEWRSCLSSFFFRVPIKNRFENVHGILDYIVSSALSAVLLRLRENGSPGSCKGGVLRKRPGWLIRKEAFIRAGLTCLDQIVRQCFPENITPRKTTCHGIKKETYTYALSVWGLGWGLWGKVHEHMWAPLSNWIRPRKLFWDRSFCIISSWVESGSRLEFLFILKGVVRYFLKAAAVSLMAESTLIRSLINRTFSVYHPARNLSLDASGLWQPNRLRRQDISFRNATAFVTWRWYNGCCY